MNSDQLNQAPSPPVRVSVGTASFDDIKAAIAAGLRDVKARPGLSLFFGLFYAAFGALLLAGLLVFDQIWIAIAVGVGFPLLAPFLAAGLYDISRRLKRGEAFTAKDVFLVIFDQQRRQYSWMSFVVLFIFWIWAYQVRIIIALTLFYQGFRSVEHMMELIFTTSGGAVFLMVGTAVGAVISTILFSITVISMPLLLDKNVDFITAMITSVKAVFNSPIVMLGWGAAIGAVTLLAVLPGFLGVIFIFPVLGHATWHLYERLVQEEA